MRHEKAYSEQANHSKAHNNSSSRVTPPIVALLFELIFCHVHPRRLHFARSTALPQSRVGRRDPKHKRHIRPTRNAVDPSDSRVVLDPDGLGAKLAAKQTHCSWVTLQNRCRLLHDPIWRVFSSGEFLSLCVCRT